MPNKWTHVRVSSETKERLAEMAASQGVGIDSLIVNMAEQIQRPRFPLNAPGDYSELWGYPLVAWRNGTLFLCKHGYPLVMLPDGQHTWLTQGHTCPFAPRE